MPIWQQTPIDCSNISACDRTVKFVLRGSPFAVSCAYVRASRFAVRGSRFVVRGSRFAVRGSRFDSSWFAVRGSQFVVRRYSIKYKNIEMVYIKA